MRSLKNKGSSLAPQVPEASEHGCTPRKRKIILISVILIGISIIVAGLFYLGFSVRVETCTASACVRTATEILRHINIRADPCEDFYRFSCGNFLQNTHLQDNRESRSGSRSVGDIAKDEIQSRIRDILEVPVRLEEPKPFNVAKQFYRACMNETAIARRGLKKVKEILKLIGGWPTLEGYNWDQKRFDWMESLHKLRQYGLNFDVFFRITVEKDDRGTNYRYVLGIHEAMYSPNEPNSEIRGLMFRYMVDIAVLFGADRNIAAEDVREVLRKYEELGKMVQDTVFDNITESDYDKRALSELQFKYRDIQWHHFLSGLLKPATNINYDDDIIIFRSQYVEFMQNFLGITSKRTLANLISWHTIQHLINFMPTEIVEKTTELVDKINGKMMNFKEPRYKTCLLETKKRLGPVLSAAYIQQFFPEDVRFKIVTMIKNIKQQAEETVRNLEWMDSETKMLVIKSLHSTGERLPSTLDLLNLLEENRKLYSQVKINETEYLESALELNLVALYKEQSRMKQTYEEDLYSDIDFVTSLEIKYSPREKLLSFPVGIFSGIYYQSHRPEYMNYGSLGSIIAQQVYHIFMRAVEGDQSPGELRSWWSPSSFAYYNQKLECLSNQYSNFKVAGLRHKHLNPTKTRDEDMADLAGMKISYDTYINWSRENDGESLLPGLNYSPNQLFWISASIRHCSKYSQEGLESVMDNYRLNPYQFQVNGLLQNLPQFAFDFGCPVGSKMNPKDKCDIW
ncbi:neprilysin-2-like [Diorhabda carinulata]|uniref:neprilysin-2-like n=1 Tax=Diorhabda carinulata TaxID=1163345 RepID=UPI0025A080EF|nr:neprilysin-2-like [Diorhabda carinulata]